jgi:hypothetical protein
MAIGGLFPEEDLMRIERWATRTTASVVLAAATLLTALLGQSWGATSELRCGTCKTIATNRFVRSRPGTRCPGGMMLVGDEARLRRRLARCERRYDCAGTEDSDAIVAAVRTRMCGKECDAGSCEAGWGDVFDPLTTSGPVGLASPVESDRVQSLEAVADFCRAHGDYDTAPPLLALPAVDTLPAWCSEEDAYEDLVALCGPPRVVVVAQGSDPNSADGSVDRPFATLTDALASCVVGTCHVLVAPGTYIEQTQMSGCTFIEGGVRIEDGAAIRGAQRPRFLGTISGRGAANILARVDVEDAYGALGASGDVLVSEAILRGGYEGGSTAWGVEGPRICRSQLSGGYSGFDISWHSARLWIAGSAVSACYEGAALSWGSRDLKVIDSTVYGAYSAVATSWGSVDVEVRGSRLGSDYAAVDIHVAPDDYDVFPTTFDVLVTHNSIAGGSLPKEDPELNILVRSNVRE